MCLLYSGLSNYLPRNELGLYESSLRSNIGHVKNGMRLCQREGALSIFSLCRSLIGRVVNPGDSSKMIQAAKRGMAFFRIVTQAVLGQPKHNLGAVCCFNQHAIGGKTKTFLRETWQPRLLWEGRAVLTETYWLLSQLPPTRNSLPHADIKPSICIAFL